MASETVKIIVCDDDARVRFGTARMLRKAGYEVVEAENGNDCLDKMQSIHPQVAIIDWVMPDIEGPEVCRLIKNNQELSATIVMLLSGKRTSEDDRADGLEIGADAYLTQPINRRSFLANIDALLRMRRAEQALQQSQRLAAVGTLAGGIAHQFNNILMGILGYTDLCREGVGDDHQIVEWLDEIKAGANRAAELTSQVLSFSRKQMVRPEVLNINEQVEGMLKMLRQVIGEEIDLKWQPAAKLWPAKIDPGQVDQILANLCVNARDAIGGAGAVVIATDNVVIDKNYCTEHSEASPGDYILLSVSDDGSGMDRETLDHVFEPFYTTKEVGTGTGLGLAAIYGIVKQNKGLVDVYSEPLEGTTIKIYLPRFVKDATDEHKEKSSAR